MRTSVLPTLFAPFWCLYSLAWRKFLNTNIAYLLLSLKILEPVQIQLSRSILEKSWKHLRWNYILLNIGLQCCGVYEIFLNRYYSFYQWVLIRLKTEETQEFKATISDINYWDQVNSWKNLWKFLNGPLCRYKSDPFHLLNVAAYWKSSNTEACAKNLSQILANNNDNGGGGLASEFMWGIEGINQQNLICFIQILH